MTDTHADRWRFLALLAVSELLGMSLWFAASAVAPQLSAQWGLSAAQAGWLTTIVQLGFVVGTATAALFNLADVMPARLLFALAAALGAVVNASVLAAPGFQAALVLRFLTGFALAGVYPPAMKMVATWFQAQRGLAIGTVVGALTVGKATPYLIHAFPSAGAKPVLLVSSTGAILAALLVASFYRDGPYRFAPREFSWGLAFWTWIPAFLAASLAVHGFRSTSIVSLVAFATIAVGGAGCVWGGLFADRKGRERLVTVSLLASGACCLLSGLAFVAPFWVVIVLSLVWGFFVIADSAQFSTLVTESVPSHAVGTALTLQTSLGFLLTMLPMQILPAAAERSSWRWVFAILAVGPAAGIIAIRKLRRLRRRVSRVMEVEIEYAP